MLRCELTVHLLRLRTLIALALVAAVPVVAGVALAGSAGHRNGDQGGLFGASPYSALNHTMASLAFIGPLVLPIVVALQATAVAAADRDWGVLRYLYVAPVTRTRLLAGKLAAVALVTLVAVLCVPAAGFLTGLVVFGWHPFHIIGAANLPAGDALARVLAATGYTVLCMLAMAAIAFVLGLSLPRGAEALAAAIAFVVIAGILDGRPAAHAVAVVLPVHYWQNWVGLFDPAGASGMALGAVVQAGWIAGCIACGWAVLRRRDPAA